MQKRRKVTITKGKVAKLFAILVLVAAGLAGLIHMARNKVSEKFGSSDTESAESVQVSKGAISTTVSGQGTLSYEDASEIVIPQSVDLTEVYVSQGQTVEAHEMLAAVNSSSVIKSMADTQTKIEAIDKEIETLIEEAEDETTQIKTNLAGRVKKIYAAEGDDVNQIMYENKALILLSLDGKMAVDVETDSLKVGDTLTVTDSQGKEYTGNCEAVWAGKATICISDDGPALDESVTLKLGEGDKSGKLYIHQPLSITGYSGRISSVKVEENQKVAKDKVLLELTANTGSINYATLLAERAELEETLKNLTVIYKEGAVYSGEAGRLTSYTESSAATTTQAAVDTVFAISPTERMNLTLNVDEADILSLKVGQTASVSIEAIGEDTYEGQITSVDTVGSSESGVTSFTAQVSLAKADGMLSGMSASAVVTIEGKEDALLLPTAAIKQTRDTTYVYTSYDEENKSLGTMVEVVTGLSNGRYTEITSGLSEGDTVYYQKTEEANPYENFKGNRGNRMNIPGMEGMPQMPGNSGNNRGGSENGIGNGIGNGSGNRKNNSTSGSSSSSGSSGSSASSSSRSSN